MSSNSSAHFFVEGVQTMDRCDSDTNCWNVPTKWTGIVNTFYFRDICWSFDLVLHLMNFSQVFHFSAIGKTLQSMTLWQPHLRQFPCKEQKTIPLLKVIIWFELLCSQMNQAFFNSSTTRELSAIFAVTKTVAKMMWIVHNCQTGHSQQRIFWWYTDMLSVIETHRPDIFTNLESTSAFASCNHSTLFESRKRQARTCWNIWNS